MLAVSQHGYNYSKSPCQKFCGEYSVEEIYWIAGYQGDVTLLLIMMRKFQELTLYSFLKSSEIQIALSNSFFL